MVMLVVSIVGVIGNSIYLATHSSEVGTYLKSILFFWLPLGLLLHPRTRRFYGDPAATAQERYQPTNGRSDIV